MDNIEFNDDSFGQMPDFQEKNPWMIQKLIDWGLVTNKKAANILLLIIAMIFFAISIFFFIKVIQGPGGGGEDRLPDDLSFPPQQQSM